MKISLDNIPDILRTKDWHWKVKNFNDLTCDDCGFVIEDNIDFLFVLQTIMYLIQSGRSEDPMADSFNLKALTFISASGKTFSKSANNYSLADLHNIKQEYLTNYLDMLIDDINRHKDIDNFFITIMENLNIFFNGRSALNELLSLPIIIEEYDRRLLELNVEFIKSTTAKKSSLPTVTSFF